MIKNLSFCLKRKDLLKQLVISKLIVSQKDFLLGYLWWVIDPLLLMVIYWFLIGVIFRRGGPDYPLFILCGLVPFRGFSISFSQSVASISEKIYLISQINFPRIFLPLTDVLTNHIKLLFGFLVIFIVALFFNVRIGLHYFYLIVPFISQIIMVSGIAMLFSVIGVYFRDIKNLVQFIARSLLYLSPVLYSIERIPVRYRDMYFLCNPIAPLLESYRGIIMYGKQLDISLVTISSLQTLVIFFIGYFFFVSNEKRFLKYI